MASLSSDSFRRLYLPLAFSSGAVGVQLNYADGRLIHIARDALFYALI